MSVLDGKGIEYKAKWIIETTKSNDFMFLLFVLSDLSTGDFHDRRLRENVSDGVTKVIGENPHEAAMETAVLLES